MKSKWLFILFPILFLGSCRKNQQPDRKNPSELRLVSPIYLQPDTTRIILSDYIPHFTSVQKIHSSSRIKIIWSQDADTALIIARKNIRPVENLRIHAGRQSIDIPLFRSTLQQITFRLPDSEHYHQVAIKADFTGWQSIPMHKENKVWSYTTLLDPGQYPYLFVADGREMLDPANPVHVPNGLGGQNSVLNIDFNNDKRPRLDFGHILPRGFSLIVQNHTDNILVYFDNHFIENKTGITDDSVYISLPKTFTDYHFLRIYACNDYGRSNDLIIPLHDGHIITNSDELSSSDFRKMIIYNIMIDRWADGNPGNNRPVASDSVLPKVNFHGGDLWGIDKHLQSGYFDSLGVNTLWISPLMRNPDGAWGHWPHPPTKFTGYHGYWPVSNIHIDSRFGSEKILHQLLNHAHARGMKVLLDYVANHVHKLHPVYRQHPEWFTPLRLPDGTLNLQKWDEHRLTTWFDTFLPTFDFSQHRVVDVMTDSALYWLKNYPLDGFRHDATKHIQTDYWRTLTRKIKLRIPHPVFQIGETYGSPQLIRSYVGSGMLDAQFDFNLYDAAVRCFAMSGKYAPDLAGAMNESLFYYGCHHLMGNISGNQDRVRFISYASGDVRFDEDGKQAGWERHITVSNDTAYRRLALLHAFNFSVPGIPVIYYGDEFGMPGANDPDNRRMMRFENRWNKAEKELFHTTARLARMRSRHMALLYGTTQIKARNNLLIIRRKYFNETYTIRINPNPFEVQNLKAYSYEILWQ